jgi:hypothetical protein
MFSSIVEWLNGNLMRIHAPVDIMLGIPPTEDITLLIAAMKQPEDTGEEWTLQREEWVAQLVEQCHQLLVHEGENYLGGWALIEPLLGYVSVLVPEYPN